MLHRIFGELVSCYTESDELVSRYQIFGELRIESRYVLVRSQTWNISKGEITFFEMELKACCVPYSRNGSTVLTFQPIGFVVQHFYDSA